MKADGVNGNDTPVRLADPEQARIAPRKKEFLQAFKRFFAEWAVLICREICAWASSSLPNALLRSGAVVLLHWLIRLPILNEQGTVLAKLRRFGSFLEASVGTAELVGAGLIAASLVFPLVLQVIASFRNVSWSLRRLGLISMLLGITGVLTWEPRTVGLLVGLGYIAWRVPELWPGIVGPKMVDLDAPIQEPGHDLFARGDFVGHLLSQVAANGVRCPRVALTADVGTGKTSVANLLRVRALEDGHLFARFDPWHFDSPKSAKEGLIATIDRALESRWGVVARYAGIRDLIARGMFGFLTKSAWAKPLYFPIEQRIRVGQRELAAAISESLKRDKKLIVFIDDLERCDPRTAYEILMYVHEIVSTPGLAILCAFDKDRFLQNLKNSLKIEDAGILDKLFDQQRPLPEPPDGSLSILRSVCLQGLGGTRMFDGSAATTIDKLGISTPRELKQFLAFLVAWMKGIGVEPIPEWMDGSLLVALLRMEHIRPHVLASTLRNDLRLLDLEQGAFRGMFSNWGDSGNSEDEGEKPSIWDLDTQAEPALEVAREAGAKTSVKAHLQWLTGTSETWPRIDLMWNLRRKLIGGANKEMLLELVGAHDLDVGFAALSDARNTLYNEMMNATFISQQKRLVNSMKVTTAARSDLLGSYASTNRWPGSDLFMQVVKGLFHVQGAPGVFAEPLDDELKLAKAMADSPASAVSDYLEPLRELHESALRSGASTHVASQLLQLVQPALVGEARVAFRAAEGIDNLMRCQERRFLRDWLFAPEQSQVRLEILREIQPDATEGSSEWHNVFTFWSTIADESIPRATELAGDRELQKLLWEIVTQVHPSLTILHIILKARAKLVALGASDALLQEPGHFDEILRDAVPWKPKELR